MPNIKHPPEILSVKTVAKSRIFEVQALELRFSNGEERVFERLKPASRAAVSVVPIWQNQLVMIKEFAAGSERYELGFAKGLMDFGETPEQSANRELQEEVGFGARRFHLLRTLSSPPNYMYSLMHVFVAEDLYPSKLEGDEPEPLEIVYYPLDQLDALIADPHFNEARSLAALYLLKDYLQHAAQESNYAD